MLTEVIAFLFASSFSLTLVTMSRRHVGKAWLCWFLLLATAIVFFAAMSASSGNLIRHSLINISDEGRPGLVARLIALSLGVFAGAAMGVLPHRNRRNIEASGILSSANSNDSFPSDTIRRSILVTTLTFATFGMCSLLLRDFLGKYLPDPSASVTAGMIAIDVAGGGRVEKLTLDISPTCVKAGADGTVYVAGYLGGYLQNGAVLRIDVDENESTLKAKMVAKGLTRPHGLAVWKDWVYVSRSGQLSRAVRGKMMQSRTGAVTRMKDLDGDGVFDFYEDVVVDLPGAQAPDGLHQNNAIAFGDDDNLYITVGTSTDHGPPVERFEGMILSCSAQGQDLKEYARGFRNPYGMCFGPSGELYVTDNDPNFAELGDKLIRVQRGKHHGHPLDALDNTQVEGIEKPIKRFSSAQGIGYIPKGTGHPWEGQLLLAAYGDDAISALKITRDGNEWACAQEFLAKINDVVDVCYSSDGSVYACSYVERALYRISFPDVPTSH
jgi:hypothetical protein